MDLKELILHCQLGEKEAFQELLGTVEKKALATAYLISGTRGIAEDIVQESYIKCFREIKNLKDPEAFKVWFFRILVRTGWEMSKKHSLLVPIDMCKEEVDLCYNLKQDIDNTIEDYELKLIVQNAVNTLSENLKTVVILYYFNDMSIDEISKVIGCLKSTVKSRLFYARTVLKKELSNYFDVESNLTLMNRKECNDNG